MMKKCFLRWFSSISLSFSILMITFTVVRGKVKFAHFEKDIKMENILVKSDFRISVNEPASKIHCAVMCFSYENCTSVFFNFEEKKCIFLVGRLDENSLYEDEMGWEFYSMQENGTNQKICNEPGYLDSFTKYEDRLHIGYDMLVINLIGNDEENIDTCRSRCLAEPNCTAFEMRFSSVCILEAIDMYDRPFDTSIEFDYYNRDFDCGCPQRQNNNIIFYDITTDGSTVTYVCPKDGRRNTSTCTSGGWGVEADSIPC